MVRDSKERFHTLEGEMKAKKEKMEVVKTEQADRLLLAEIKSEPIDKNMPAIKTQAILPVNKPSIKSEPVVHTESEPRGSVGKVDELGIKMSETVSPNSGTSPLSSSAPDATNGDSINAVKLEACTPPTVSISKPVDNKHTETGITPSAEDAATSKLERQSSEPTDEESQDECLSQDEHSADDSTLKADVDSEENEMEDLSQLVAMLDDLLEDWSQLKVVGFTPHFLLLMPI